MKEKLLKAIKEHPGCRVTTLAYLVRENKMDVIKAVHELERESKVYYEAHHDTANMEFYDKWYVKEVR